MNSMTTNATVALIEQRASTNLFDAQHELTPPQIEGLVRLATRAPTAYNLQNWKFIAVRTPQAKSRLRHLAHGQAKVSDAAVTFIVCGQLPDHHTIAERLHPSVMAGFMAPAAVTDRQQDACQRYADPQVARDEAVRSAALAAATLMLAAQAQELASCPMIGFDANAVAREFGLAADELPVMLVAVGRAAPGNWPPKPRRAVADVLQLS